MKRYRYYIRESKYLDEEQHNVLLDDTLEIDIDIGRYLYKIASSTSAEYDRFPGVFQFKEDVLKILEDEYHFEVIEDVYDGVLQKGHISNRADSASLYFDTYYDLSNATEPKSRLGIASLNIPDSGKVYCYIHLRFSDHLHPDLGDKEHNAYLDRNIDKYANRADVTHVMKEEVFELREEALMLAYKDALRILKDDLDFRITSWVKKAEHYKKIENKLNL